MSEYELKIFEKYDPLKQMQQADDSINKKLSQKLEELQGLKFNIGMEILMKKVAVGGKNTKTEVILNKFTFIGENQTITDKTEISNAVQSMNKDIESWIDTYTHHGSGWTVVKITRHFLSVNKYTPLAAKSYIKLPDEITNRKATINIQNKDENCFMYCLGRALDQNPEKHHLERVNKHLREVCHELGLDKIKMPVSMKDIPNIEHDFNISINVFGHKNADIHPLSLTKLTNRNHVNLLVTSNTATDHYVLIKDFNRLCSNVTKHDGTKYFCMNCIQFFSSQEILERHKPNCMLVNGKQAVDLPKEGSKVKFNKLQRLVPVPFVIYADLEALLIPIQNCAPDNSASYTLHTQKHEACSYGYKVVCSANDKYSKPFKMFRGEDSIYKFFEALFEEEKEINEYMKTFYTTRMILTTKQIEKHNITTKCYVCHENFTDEEEKRKVRDHCHVSGKYRGAACNTCNLQMKLTRKIPVVFHNLRGYDSHMLMQELGRFNKKINIIPNNMEKYMSFSVGSEYEYQRKDKTIKGTNFNLTFIDSFQFMSSSLSQLVDNLKDSDLDNFKYVREEFGDDTSIMTRKGIYPYSYMDSWNKFDVNPQELLKENFTNDLTGDKIKDKDFEFYNKVCEKFYITNLGEYHDLYLKSDVLLLADVFENFRKMCLKYYRLDPAHYISAPGLARDACLKMTKIELELISDIDQYLFVEMGLRGGMSVITHRKGEANNKYMQKYDEGKPSKYIAYLDANNLYGWAMSQYMPYGGFKWINPKDFKLENVRDNSEKAHMLEVDIEYPKELHDLHNDYPFCPEQAVVKDEMLSDYSKMVAQQHNLKTGKSQKLISSLYNKEKYIIHERNLKQAVGAGLVVTKIHRVLEFSQKPWMKKYIDFNTEKRKLSKNEFEKDFF